MKFAIDAPIIDTHGRYYRDGRTEPVASPPWDVPLAIAGHQWLVRNADQFLSKLRRVRPHHRRRGPPGPLP